MSTTEEQVQQLSEQLEALEPPATRVWTLGDGETKRVYAQAPLGVVGKMRLFQVLAVALDEAMKDGGGRALAGLFGANEEEWDGESISLDQIQGGVDFFAAIVKLSRYAPDLLLDVYCVALRVPANEWDIAKQLMELPENEGGLSDDDGIEILDVFVAQNGRNLRSFFVEKMLPLLRKFREQLGGGSQSSRPSSPTPPSTPSQSQS